MPNNRRQYSEEFKQETVRRYSTSGKPVLSFARHIGIDQSILHRWLKRYNGCAAEESITDDNHITCTANEVRQLRREIAEVRHSVEVLRGIVEKSFLTRYHPDSDNEKNFIID